MTLDQAHVEVAGFIDNTVELFGHIVSKDVGDLRVAAMGQVQGLELGHDGLHLRQSGQNIAKLLDAAAVLRVATVTPSASWLTARTLLADQLAEEVSLVERVVDGLGFGSLDLTADLPVLSRMLSSNVGVVDDARRFKLVRASESIVGQVHETRQTVLDSIDKSLRRVELVSIAARGAMWDFFRGCAAFAWGKFALEERAMHVRVVGPTAVREQCARLMGEGLLRLDQLVQTINRDGGSYLMHCGGHGCRHLVLAEAA